MTKLIQPVVFFDVGTQPRKDEQTGLIQPAYFAMPNTGGLQTLPSALAQPPQVPPADISAYNMQRTAHQIAEELKRKCKFALVEGNLYYFNDICYQLLTPQQACMLIYNLQRADVAAHGNCGIVKQVYDLLVIDSSISIETPPPFRYCAFVNGVLDLTTRAFTPPNSALFLTSYVNCSYHSTAHHLLTPTFDVYLQQVTNGDATLISRIWESLGYLIVPDMSAKKFFLLYGPGDTGKSLFGNFVISLFPPEAVSALDINRLGERFSLAELVDKRINASMDLASSLIKSSTISTIKMLTGGDLITGERKYGAPFKFQNSCKLLFALNGRLRTYEDDQAFMNRIVLLPFLYPVPREQQDRGLLTKLLAERQAVVHKALYHFRNLQANNYTFTGDAQVDELLRQQCASVALEQNARQVLQEFVVSRCVLDDTMKTQTQTLYNAYCIYCSEKGLPQVADCKQFSRLLSEVYPTLRSGKWREGNQENPRSGYIGILLLQ